MKSKKEVLNKIEEIIKVFEGNKNIISIYLYGSILSNKFKPSKSDVDLLIIVDDSSKPFVFIKNIKKLFNSFKNIKFDVNIVFLSEFKKRWHIYRPPSYFIGIKYKSKLLLGKDVLRGVKDSELSKDKVYKRIVDLSQSSRGIYINSKESDFWASKYVGWLKMVVLEILFLTGEFELDFSTGLRKIKRKYRDLNFLDKLNKNKLNMRDINEIAEEIRVFFYKNFIKK